MSAESEERPFRATVTEEDPTVRVLDVVVAEPHVRRAFDDAFRDLGKRVKVRGFRPGKVPRSVLEKLYGPSVAEQIQSRIVAETLAGAVEESGLTPVSEPSIESEPPRRDAEFRYRARIEVQPAIELPELEGLPGRRPSAEVGESDVEQELEALRQRSAPVVEEPPGTPIANGHIAVVDFEGRIDGAPFEGGSGSGVELEIGSGRSLPGFEEQLLGAMAGDDREVRVSFPDDHPTPKLAGREAVFSVHVHEVKERRVPALDDEFAKDVGDFETLDALRVRIREELTSARMAAADRELRRTVMDSLIERTAFDVPPGLVERELERQLEMARRRLEGSVPERALRGQLEQWREEWRPRAEREVRERLLLDAVATRQEIQVEDAEIDARIASLAEQQGTRPDVLTSAYGGRAALARAIGAQLRDDRAVDFLIGRANVEETPESP